MAGKEGFGGIIMWRHKMPYRDIPEDERKAFYDKVHEAIRRAREKGLKQLGCYRCDWSSEWIGIRVFEFPDVKVFEELIRAWEEAGTERYFEARTIIGRRVGKDEDLAYGIFR